MKKDHTLEFPPEPEGRGSAAKDGVNQYLRRVIAEPFVAELGSITRFREVTSNTQLLGRYTEAAIRSLVDRVVSPMRVSTGAVLDYPMPDPLAEIDIIVWAPFPAGRI